MPIYRFIVRFIQLDNPRALGLLHDARALGFEQLKLIQCEDIYFIEGQLSQEECKRLALSLLTDPVTQSSEWAELPVERAEPDLPSIVVEVALRPGVTDPVADEIVRAAREMGMAGVERASTGHRYHIQGAEEEKVRTLARRLLANMVIHRWKIGEIEPSFPGEIISSGEVETIRLRGLNADELLAVSRSRRAALDLAEMQAIQAYCEQEKRELSDVEFETIAQTWSEHCGHKTFKGKITVDQGDAKKLEIDSLYKTYIRSVTDEINAAWVLSAFVDNAGIIDLDGENEVSFKVETHNHPSAIEPFGGANTGVGGVIRDVIGVSHKPVANTDVLCFGMQNCSFDEIPAGVLHPRRVMSGVVSGVQDYGNKMGIPTVNGAILFDPGYAANPLVFCGTVGIAPKGRHVRKVRKADRVIVLGGRTGRDGLRGATFSSMTMDAQTGEVSGSSVQIGNPIIEKGLVDAILPARDLGLYSAITDCGAGGLSSAVGEMASVIGADVDLTDVRLKYPGLAPWEIWLSEAQERMVLAVPPDKLTQLQEICDIYNVELTDIGAFTGSGRLVVRYDKEIVLDLSNEFLHNGIPQRRLEAKIVNKEPIEADNVLKVGSETTAHDLSETLLKLLAHPNIVSKASVIRIYDHEVQGGTVVKPLTGAENDGPSDACVLKPLGAQGRAGIAVASGINAEYGKKDAYSMAMAVVDEAVRNAVAVGADPQRIAILDNFCWGDPLRPETLGSLVEACRGCRDAALLFRTPFISGKDSLNNEYLGMDGQRHAIPPTLLISSIGVMADVMEAITMDFKEAGNVVYLVGDFRPVFGGSHFNLVHANQETLNCESIPRVNKNNPKVYRAFHNLVSAKLVQSAHDLSEGGLAVAVAEMCIGGRLGLEMDLQTTFDWAGESVTIRVLFGETTGCLLVEVKPENAGQFEAAFTGLPITKLGLVSGAPELRVRAGNNFLCNIPIPELVAAWNTPLRVLHSVPMKPKALILLAQGTNRDQDVAEALTLCGAEPEIVPLNSLRASRQRWVNYQMLVLPGGFSYADALGAGKLLAIDMQTYFTDEIQKFVLAGKPVIGICNGFQALVKSGILPGESRDLEEENKEQATLTFNERGHFECRWVALRPVSQKCVWTKGLSELIECPIAHGEGNFQVSNQAILSTLTLLDQIALVYVHPNGTPANGEFPTNPNGARLDIAGICSPQGNVLGLMPHPENHIFAWQHPQWRRGVQRHSGLSIFKNGVNYAEEA